jgi:hypothetical protein
MIETVGSGALAVRLHIDAQRWNAVAAPLRYCAISTPKADPIARQSVCDPRARDVRRDESDRPRTCLWRIPIHAAIGV